MISLNSLSLAGIFSALIIMLPPNAWSASEVLPQFQSHQDELDFIGRVQRQIPFANNNTQTYLQLQQNGIELLRKKFPNYDRWMEEKPSPVILEIFRENYTIETKPHLMEAQLEEIQSKVQAHLQSQLKKATDLSELKKQGLIQLGELLTLSKNSVRGLLVGLSLAIPIEKRSDFFKLGNPQRQIQYLREQNISDATLRASNFKASTLGLDQATVTMDEVLEIADQRIDTTRTTLLQLAYLRLLDKVNENSEVLKAPPTLEAYDFDFALRTNDPFLEGIVEKLTSQFANAKNDILQSIDAFQAGIPRSWFEQKQTTITHKKMLGTVYEVHPYLGVHRGCIGGDCSTTHSPLFPYSPWEHDFYIKNADGKFVGYISGTRIRVNGVSSFYMRDLQGASLSPALAEAILHGFPHLLKHFGVEKFIIAAPAFTNAQNNSQALRNLLTKYTSDTSKFVPLDFVDAEIRNYIGQTANFRSSYAYDSPNNHKVGVSFVPTQELDASLKFNVYPGTLPVPETRTRLQAFLAALKARVKYETMETREFPEIDSRVLQQDVTLFMNLPNGYSQSKTVANFFQDLKTVLIRHGGELSPAFIDQYGDLIANGFLNCIDAFDINKPENTKLGEKFIILLSRQHLSYEQIMNVVSKNNSFFKQSKKFMDLIQLYSERMQPQDIFQLMGFARAGLSEALVPMKDEKNKSRIEAAILFQLQRTPAELGLPATAGLPVVDLLVRLPNIVNNYIDTGITLIATGLSHYGLGFDKIENPELRRVLLAPLLQSLATYGFQHNMAVQKMLLLIGNNSYELLSPSEQVLLAGWAFRLKIDSQFPQLLVERLSKNLDTMAAFEISMLAKQGLPAAVEAAKTPEVKQKTRELVLSYFGANPEINESISKEILKYNYYRTRAFDFGWAFPVRITEKDIATTLQKFNELLKPYDLDFSDLMKIDSIRKNFSDSWLGKTDLFTHPSSKWLEINFSVVAEHLINSQTFEVGLWAQMIKSSSYLQQKPVFRNFIESIRQEAMKGTCASCIEGLAYLAAFKTIPDLLPNSRELLSNLTKSSSQAVVSYAMIKAYKAKIALPLDSSISTKMQEAYVAFGPNNREFHNPDLLEGILKVFTQVKGDRKYIRDFSITLMKNSSDNSLAIHAALAFLRNGGQKEAVKIHLTEIYDREELFQEKDIANADFFKRVRSRFEKRTASCHELF